ncbi:MAG: transposase [Candidatus Thiodiazotropha sp. (ex Lucinoma aequizonata)]|nr:transposase [Candidatus Thiodiazotropha sp. (ex Lucinoma aequizonata)]MCU7889771.1 transposase [Candidatus Thiodiazotropha sp. (ex Lucinoma aequizonata)]MCU7896581.1 transposase [Candidatus Thiodiazotropha sp. (ex Lucinoma aequizonata)]MCU7901696.1 transposase [Candidatus Thiodiazotropha sp. (ex Lucinoma aequizonata)]MCU7910390.1 transposase [Candidatus Thiodiazotropha sp. (ex Lucinoma aequizonata)]
MIGNVKKAFNGTYHTVGDEYFPRYFAKFCYRFDRRSLTAMESGAKAVTPR